MLLNSKYSNFYFSFPKGWLYPEIEENYKIFIERLPLPFRNVTDFLNYTIQTVSWPAVNIETVNQINSKPKRDVLRNGTPISNSERTYRTGFNLELSSEKDFNVIFRTTEGFLNYWIMHDQLELYHKYGEDRGSFLGDVRLGILDHYGYLVMTRIYKDIVYKGISDLDLSFSTNLPEYRTFNCTFTHNSFELKRELQ